MGKMIKFRGETPVYPGFYFTDVSIVEPFKKSSDKYKWDVQIFVSSLLLLLCQLNVVHSQIRVPVTNPTSLEGD